MNSAKTTLTDPSSKKFQHTLFFLSLLLTCTIMIPSPAHAANNKQKLKKIERQIHHVQNELNHAQQQRNQLEKHLKKSEVSIANLTKRQRQNQLLSEEQQLKLDQLALKTTSSQQHIKQLQNQLADQVHVAYLLGRHSYLKMLLNQENPAQLSRTYHYYQYLVKHQSDYINQFKKLMVQLQESKQHVRQHHQLLIDLQSQLAEQQTQLLHNAVERKNTLQRINNLISSKSEKLNALHHDRKALENLIRQLKHAHFTHIPQGVSFARLKHKLPWPTHGRIQAHFNEPINASQLRRNGVIIQAPIGQNVYAIASGQVLFSRWMPGFGLLLILDHGHGYMTLYGRNMSLYKTVGEHVNAGDLIAKVGNTGGYHQSGLYFAIRHNGTPANPGIWCHNTGRNT